MWYKAGFTILVLVNVLAVVVGLEWWPLSRYPMYAFKMESGPLSVYRWKMTDDQGNVSDIPIRRLPVLSSFSLSLESMNASQIDQSTKNHFINSYLKSEMHILGFKDQKKKISVYGYSLIQNSGNECMIKLAQSSLCVKENMIFEEVVSL